MGLKRILHKEEDGTEIWVIRDTLVDEAAKELKENFCENILVGFFNICTKSLAYKPKQCNNCKKIDEVFG